MLLSSQENHKPDVEPLMTTTKLCLQLVLFTREISESDVFQELCISKGCSVSENFKESSPVSQCVEEIVS
ncbi:unnamed protein product [Microthlaspi erraticum]|uniref:Uncharacterized protein n=1 Tax=Microthlaspi erraticum TaxID=1685480 RepID=A0A6D2KS06_9BRAS|nr:unnamed protein product [Microthlaspi erraticum]